MPVVGIVEEEKIEIADCFTTMFDISSLQSFRLSGVPQNELMDETNLLRATVTVCQVQKKGGRFFILGNPLSSRGWRDKKVLELWNEDGVFEVICDQCEYGLNGTARAKMPTRVLTNMPATMITLSTRSQGSHVHVPVIHGRTEPVQTYPRELRTAMLQALQLELKVRVCENVR